MKKIIRKGVFESNSSSSHVLIIGKRTQPMFDRFPRNVDGLAYELIDMEVADSDEWRSDIHRLYGEVQKARFMLNILAAHINAEDEHYPEISYYAVPEKDLRKSSEFESYRDYALYLDSIPRNKNRTFETMIKQKPFMWFKEMLEEETGIKFKFVEPKDDYFPFYDAVYIDEDLNQIVDIDWFNEEAFKARIKEIVFDDNIVILDADVPYGSDVDLTI